MRQKGNFVYAGLKTGALFFKTSGNYKNTDIKGAGKRQHDKPRGEKMIEA